MIVLPERPALPGAEGSCPVVALTPDYQAWTPEGTERPKDAGAVRREAMRNHPSNHRRSEILRAVALPEAEGGEAGDTPVATVNQGSTAPTGREDKLRVLVSLDSNLDSAQVNVRGSVTVTNLCALYAILRRTNEFMPGMDISVDLSLAHTCPEAVRELEATARNRALPIAANRADTPAVLGGTDPSTGYASTVLPLRLQIRTAGNG
ncbi:MAG: hypothetical protein JWO93_2423 [Micrococcaceae bacterium]|jgi:hypothetical protein|nr:hypothetical protein [Micrococcaceae bacterium]